MSFADQEKLVASPEHFPFTVEEVTHIIGKALFAFRDPSLDAVQVSLVLAQDKDGNEILLYGQPDSLYGKPTDLRHVHKKLRAKLDMLPGGQAYAARTDARFIIEPIADQLESFRLSLYGPTMSNDPPNERLESFARKAAQQLGKIRVLVIEY